jgi:leader peptidase (prepilin peptidase)/N-methyltransferase
MTSPLLPILAFAIVGPVIGSFLGTLVLWLPAGKPVVAARSVCPHCGRQLTALELIPLLSWGIQYGRCRGCRQAISAFYPAMEISAALLPLWAATATGGLPLLFSCLLGWILLALAAMDLRVFRLSDRLTLPMLVLGILAAAILDWHRVFDHALGAIVGFFTLFSVGFAYKALRGQEGMGAGDAKLLAAGGAWIGWQGLAPALLIATASALFAVLVARVRGHPIEATTRIPFGTFLAIGIWIVWLYAPLGL